MILSDRDIKQAIESGMVEISPMNESDIQPCSVDLHLGSSFISHKWRGSATGYRLKPGEFILATTKERVRLGDGVLGRLEGKSSIARLGIIIHTTAGFIDPGFNGEITLEMVNFSGHDVFLEVGQPIAQICFEELSSPCERPYGSAGLGSHYQGQMGATASWMASRE